MGGEYKSNPLQEPVTVLCREKGRDATLTEILAVFIDHSADAAVGGTALPPPLLWSGDTDVGSDADDSRMLKTASCVDVFL